MKMLWTISAIIAMCILCFTVCGSSEPCVKCGNTPTKKYENTATREKEYYCSKCTSECMWCQKREATKHCISSGGSIMFICDKCYEDLHPNTAE